MTVIRQPFEELAGQAVESIIKLIGNKPVKKMIILDSIQLIQRDTTKPDPHAIELLIPPEYEQ